MNDIVAILPLFKEVVEKSYSDLQKPSLFDLGHSWKTFYCKVTL